MKDALRDAWKDLDREAARLSAVTLRELFDADPARFDRLSACHTATGRHLLLDYSKCRLDTGSLRLLQALADAAGLAAHRDAMFRGDIINATERRAVLHTALRNAGGGPLFVGDRDVAADVAAVLSRLAAFCDDVRAGRARGMTDEPFATVVNIGIGGSDLGPAMATQALRPFHDGPQIRFVSNVDAANLVDTLADLSPATTLFVVASKTFTTVETMTNAVTARAWLAARLGEDAVPRHFVAVSSALDKVAAFGIPTDRTFGFWDWVGGRYSVWSAVGLPLMIAVGPDNFRQFLAGARDIDEHFRTAPFERNLPILLGMIGLWHRSVCGYPTRAVIPYAQRLSRLPAFLQQLEMESNGKRVDLDGRPVARDIGTVVWGTAGTDAQHSFFQMLHQGQQTIPVEFILAAQGLEPGLEHHHRLLASSCLAQSEALALGRTEAEADALLRAQGQSEAEARRLAPHKTFPGNRPSLTLLIDRLDPFALGQLIALYEHRVFVEAAIHGINAFDQWGVELGKDIALQLEPVVAGQLSSGPLNASTHGLAQLMQRWTAGSG